LPCLSFLLCWITMLYDDSTRRAAHNL
jgi:hypothetical protein